MIKRLEYETVGRLFPRIYYRVRGEEDESEFFERRFLAWDWDWDWD